MHRPALYEQGFDSAIALPYGLTLGEVQAAMEDVYDLLNALNRAAVSKGVDRLEELMLGNTFSGFISELAVKSISNHSESLTRNLKIGGHPDLIPVDAYPENAVLRGDRGIEVKVSRHRSGWQGHNPEECWVMVFQYAIDTITSPPQERAPFEFERVMIARLNRDDWSFSGRSGESRRTPTASILKRGTDKLHANALYQRPSVFGRQTQL